MVGICHDYARGLQQFAEELIALEKLPVSASLSAIEHRTFEGSQDGGSVVSRNALAAQPNS